MCAGSSVGPTGGQGNAGAALQLEDPRDPGADLRFGSGDPRLWSSMPQRAPGAHRLCRWLPLVSADHHPVPTPRASPLCWPPAPPPRICSEASLGQQSLAFAECPEGRPGAQTSPRNRAEGSLQQRTCTRPQGGGRAHLREQSWQHRPFFLYYMGTECSLCKSERPDQVELRKI